MFDSIFLLFTLLFVKHWYIDFVNQSDVEVKGKGIYGNRDGIMHSFKHGAATAVIVFLFVLDPFFAVLLGLIDFLIHYHVDYCKMRYGNRDITTKAFWAQLGLDQLAHYMTYLFIVWAMV
jgi:hypothetical protein